MATTTTTTLMKTIIGRHEVKTVGGTTNLEGEMVLRTGDLLHFHFAYILWTDYVRGIQLPMAQQELPRCLCCFATTRAPRERL
jgi:hypothetical protein